MTATQNREDIVTTAETRRILTRRERAVYRTSTGLVLAVMLFSIVNFVFNDHFPFPNGREGAFAHLGFPPYFKVELTIAKILGVLALVIPTVPFVYTSEETLTRGRIPQEKSQSEATHVTCGTPRRSWFMKHDGHAEIWRIS